MLITKIQENKLKRAGSWFANLFKRTISNKKKDSRPTDITDFGQSAKKIRNWNLYVMTYDALNKKTLETWDSIPMFFPFSGEAGASGPKIKGINTHYLRPDLRLAFFEQLTTLMEKTASKKGYDPNDLDSVPPNVFEPVIGRYMNAIYTGSIGGPGKYLRAAIRTYLISHIRSKWTLINPSEYENASRVILPKWNNSSASETYKYVAEQYNKYKNNNWNNIY